MIGGPNGSKKPVYKNSDKIQRFNQFRLRIRVGEKRVLLDESVLGSNGNVEIS